MILNRRPVVEVTNISHVGAIVVGNPAATVITSSPRLTARSPSNGDVNVINASRFALEPELTNEQYLTPI